MGPTPLSLALAADVVAALPAARGSVLAGCGPLRLGAGHGVGAAGTIARVSGPLPALAAAWGPRRKTG